MVSKVKGHATEEHIQQGIATREDQIGNDRSDKAATEAKRQQRLPQQNVLQRMATRWANWKAGVKLIQNMMLNILEATRSQRTQQTTGCSLTTLHRKALVEIKWPPFPEERDVRGIRRSQSALPLGHSKWQDQIAAWLENGSGPNQTGYR